MTKKCYQLGNTIVDDSARGESTKHITKREPCGKCDGWRAKENHDVDVEIGTPLGYTTNTRCRNTSHSTETAAR